MKWTIINCAISNWIMWILIIGPSAVTGKVVWTWAVCQSIRKLDFQGKILYGKKWSKWLIKGSFQLFENLCHQFFLKMVLNKKIVFNISLCKPHVLRSSSSRVLVPTNSQPIRLQDSLEEYLLIEWLGFCFWTAVFRWRGLLWSCHCQYVNR